jgi:nitrite reductase/ring-hydroxylating ferredoxin subunit
MGARLGDLAHIPDGGSAGVAVDAGGERRLYLAVRRGADVFVYLNSCPHLGSPLDIRPGHFLSLDRRHIQCSTHGALFRIEDGFCVSGPCAGASLIPAAVRVRSGVVYLAD